MHAAMKQKVGIADYFDLACMKAREKLAKESVESDSSHL